MKITCLLTSVYAHLGGRCLPLKPLSARYLPKRAKIRSDSTKPSPGLAGNLLLTSATLYKPATNCGSAQIPPPSPRGNNLSGTVARSTPTLPRFVAYEGDPLESGQRYYWQVRVTDNQGNTSEWSAPAFWQMALLEPTTEFRAQWIGPGYAEDCCAATQSVLS